MSDETINRWTEGVCGDGAAILRDGVPVSISNLLSALNYYEPGRKTAATHAGFLEPRDHITGPAELRPPPKDADKPLHWIMRAGNVVARQDGGPDVWRWYASEARWEWLDPTVDGHINGYSGGYPNGRTGAADAYAAGNRYLGPAAYVPHAPATPFSGTAGAAMREVERLRADVELKGRCMEHDQKVISDMMDEIARLRAENAELRAGRAPTDAEAENAAAHAIATHQLRNIKLAGEVDWEPWLPIARVAIAAYRDAATLRAEVSAYRELRLPQVLAQVERCDEAIKQYAEAGISGTVHDLEHHRMRDEAMRVVRDIGRPYTDAIDTLATSAAPDCVFCDLSAYRPARSASPWTGLPPDPTGDGPHWLRDARNPEAAPHLAYWSADARRWFRWFSNTGDSPRWTASVARYVGPAVPPTA